jgi:phenylpropionate dioxygenase-like ring-hydroxylating dioxygenase large terminal subunit
MQMVLNTGANYQLINDNLCDLSHVAYVHENTLARDATDWVEREATYTKVDNGVGVTRWIVGSQPLPIPGLPERVDIWSSYEFYAPGIMSLLITYYPIGTAEKSNFGTPDVKQLFAIRTAHAATPATEKTTNYHFGVSLLADQAPSQEVLDVALTMVTVAFQEDKVTIEAQQASLDRYPDVVLRNTVHDKALVRIRRLISKKINLEQVSPE